MIVTDASFYDIEVKIVSQQDNKNPDTWYKLWFVYKTLLDTEKLN